MLVLSRLKDQAIIIGTGKDETRIVVSDISGNKVRLAIKAPDHIKVDREEVRERKQREGEIRTL